MGRGARAELQTLYREYKSRYGESPFAVGREQLTRALNDDIRKTGVPGVTSHAIRSTVVTKIVRAKGPTVAQQFMKHRNLSTTARYVGNLLTPALQKGLGQLLQAGMPNEVQDPESVEG
jgi:integrase